MTWGVVGGAAIGVGGSLISGNQASKATDRSIKASQAESARAEALNRERYGESTRSLSPFMATEDTANRQLAIEMGLGDQVRESELAAIQQRINALQSKIESNPADSAAPTGGGAISRAVSSWLVKNDTNQVSSLQDQLNQEQAAYDALLNRPADGPTSNYMNLPGYQGAIDEGVKTVNQGEANAGNLYSGSRGLALRDVGQGVQQSYYNNYMNILQSMAKPATTTNLASLGLNQAASQASQNAAAVNSQNNLRLAGAEARGSQIADITGALSSGLSAYIDRPQTPPPSGGVGMTGMNDYSGFV